MLHEQALIGLRRRPRLEDVGRRGCTYYGSVWLFVLCVFFFFFFFFTSFLLFLSGGGDERSTGDMTGQPEQHLEDTCIVLADFFFFFLSSLAHVSVVVAIGHGRHGDRLVLGTWVPTVPAYTYEGYDRERAPWSGQDMGEYGVTLRFHLGARHAHTVPVQLPLQHSKR